MAVSDTKLQKRISRRVDDDVIVFIQMLAVAGRSAAEIHRHLEASDRFAGRKLPTVRTIQRIVNDLGPADPSGPWQLDKAEPGTERLVLDVLAEVVHFSRGRRQYVTNDEAEWIVRLDRATRPREEGNYMMLMDLYALVRQYMARIARGEATTDLDLYIAFRQLGDRNPHRSYTSLVKRGKISRFPTLFFVGDESLWDVLEREALALEEKGQDDEATRQ